MWFKLNSESLFYSRPPQKILVPNMLLLLGFYTSVLSDKIQTVDKLREKHHNKVLDQHMVGRLLYSILFLYIFQNSPYLQDG